MEVLQDYEPIFPEKTIEYATFWERFGAAFLDGLILAVPNYIITYLITGTFFDRHIDYPSTLVNTIIGWLYCALQESGPAQATLGKRALGLKVTNMEGGRASFGQASGRHFAKWISLIILLIGYLMVLWDDKRQALHDKMAGTLVVKGAQ